MHLFDIIHLLELGQERLEVLPRFRFKVLAKDGEYFGGRHGGCEELCCVPGECGVLEDG